MECIYKPHPKPLSAKTLAGRYEKLGLGDKKIAFLHKLFAAAANLYGLIELVELARVYRDLGKVLKDNIYWQRQYVKGITKTDICCFSDVAKRDGSCSYELYDSIEIFCDGNENAANRFLVARELIGKGRGKLHEVYRIIDNINNSAGYCVPEDFLEYAEPMEAPEIGEIRKILYGLKSRAEEIPEDTCSINKVIIPNKWKGQCLKNVFAKAEGDFHFYLLWGTKEYMPPKVYDILFDEQGQCRNYADKVLRYLIYDTGRREFDKNALHILFKNLESVKAEDRKGEFNKLVQLYQNYNNNLRMRVNMGWKPVELSQKMIDSGQRPVLQFGPGIKELFKSGQLNEEDFIKQVMKSNHMDDAAKQMILEALENMLKE